MVTSRHISRSKRTKSKAKRREIFWAAAFMLPSLLGVCIFLLIPSLDTLRTAFTTPAGEFAGLKNFDTIFHNGAFQMAARNTARFMFTCIPALLVFSLLLALGLSGRRMRGMGGMALRACFLLPMTIPVSSIAFLWQMIFHSHGMLNGLLSALGMGADWLGGPNSFWVLCLTYIWRNVGYDMVLFLAALSAIPESLYEAAMVDGAGSVTIFFKITIPQLLPSLFTVTVLSLLNAFKVYREVYLLAGNYPHENIYMFQHLLNNWFSKMDMQKLCAAAVVMALVVGLLIALLSRMWAKEKD